MFIFSLNNVYICIFFLCVMNQDLNLLYLLWNTFFKYLIQANAIIEFIQLINH